MKFSPSIKVYIALILVVAILSAVSVYVPTFPGLVPTGELPAPKWVLALANAGIVLVLYGGLGFIGLKLSRKIGFPDLWNARISMKQRLVTPAIIGAVAGIFLIISDALFSRYHDMGPLPHPQFPASIIASITAGIGEELLFRLFFISFWVWLISHIILRKKWQNSVFWIVSIFSALVFAIGHLPAVMILYDFKSLSEIPPALLSEIILLNGVVSLIAAYYFRKYGFLAAAGIHFWTDVVWHVLWGLF